MRTQIPVVVIVINFSPEVKLPPTPFSWILSRLAHHSPFPRFLHHFIRHLILLRLEGNTKTNPSHATNVTNVTFLQTTPTGSGGGGGCALPWIFLIIIRYNLVVWQGISQSHLHLFSYILHLTSVPAQIHFGESPLTSSLMLTTPNAEPCINIC